VPIRKYLILLALPKFGLSVLTQRQGDSRANSQVCHACHAFCQFCQGICVLAIPGPCETPDAGHAGDPTLGGHERGLAHVEYQLVGRISNLGLCTESRGLRQVWIGHK
jgi:hypothetical protein